MSDSDACWSKSDPLVSWAQDDLVGFRNHTASLLEKIWPGGRCRMALTVRNGADQYLLLIAEVLRALDTSASREAMRHITALIKACNAEFPGTIPSVGQRWVDRSMCGRQHRRELVIVSLHEEHGPKFGGAIVALCDQYLGSEKQPRRTRIRADRLMPKGERSGYEYVGEGAP